MANKIDETQLAEIEARKAFQYGTMVSLTVAERDALISTVRHLTEENETLKEELFERQPIMASGIQEQEKSLCGAPRPDDGSECAYGFCPRPRDGCSEYCAEHHASMCAVQEQEAKQ